MTILHPLLFGYSPSNFRSLGEAIYVHIDMYQTFFASLRDYLYLIVLFFKQTHLVHVYKIYLLHIINVL